jgi:hypothetical protein
MEATPPAPRSQSSGCAPKTITLMGEVVADFCPNETEVVRRSKQRGKIVFIKAGNRFSLEIDFGDAW